MVNATNFDGSTDYFLRGGDLTGNADGAVGTISFWVRPASVSVLQRIVTPGSPIRIVVNVTNNGVIGMAAFNSAGGLLINFIGATALTLNGWNHVLGSWDTAVDAHFYIDDAEDGNSPVSTTAGDIDYTGTNWSIGAESNGAAKLNGCLSEFYFNIDERIDFSVEANRRKFVSADVGTIDLGADGSLPTGSAPIIYLPNPFSSFGTNAGTGGNFTDQGSVADCVDTPPVGSPPPEPLTPGLHRPTKRYVLPDGRQFGNEAEARAELAKIQAQERAIRRNDPFNKKWVLPAEPQPEPPPVLPSNNWQLPPKKLTLPKKTYRLPPKRKLKRPRDFTGWPDIKD